MIAVFRDAQSHCCLRVYEDDMMVKYIAIVDDGGHLLWLQPGRLAIVPGVSAESHWLYCRLPTRAEKCGAVG